MSETTLPLTVGDRHVDGVAAIASREVLVDLARLLAGTCFRRADRSGLVRRGCMCRVDFLATRGRVFLRDQRLQHVGRNAPRIRQVRRPIRERDALRFDQEVQLLGGIVAERADVVAFEDIHHLEDDESLRVRRQLEHVVAAIAGRDRIDPLGFGRREIGRVEQPVALLHVGGNGGARSGPCRTRRVRRCAIVSSVRARFGLREDVARLRRVAARQKRRRRCRVGATACVRVPSHCFAMISETA